jgi:hypothetical protein
LGVRQRDFDVFGLPNRNRWLNQRSIGYEHDCLGPLMPAEEHPGFYRSVVYRSGRAGRILVPERDVTYYPDGYRGYHIFETYTPAQLAYTERMLRYLCAEHGIPTDYREDQWELSEAALRGDPGIFQHVSYRADKADCNPQPALIAMLKRLHPKKAMVPVTAPLPKVPFVFTPKRYREMKQRDDLLSFALDPANSGKPKTP